MESHAPSIHHELRSCLYRTFEACLETDCTDTTIEDLIPTYIAKSQSGCGGSIELD